MDERELAALPEKRLMAIIDDIIKFYDPCWPEEQMVATTGPDRGKKIATSAVAFNPIRKLVHSPTPKERSLCQSRYISALHIPRVTAGGSSFFSRLIFKIALGLTTVAAAYWAYHIDYGQGPIPWMVQRWDLFLDEVRINFGSFAWLLVAAFTPKAISHTLPKHLPAKLIFRRVSTGPNSRILFFQDSVVFQPNTRKQLRLERSGHSIQIRVAKPQHKKWSPWDDYELRWDDFHLYGLDLLIDGKVHPIFEPCMSSHDAKIVMDHIKDWFLNGGQSEREAITEKLSRYQPEKRLTKDDLEWQDVKRLKLLNPYELQELKSRLPALDHAQVSLLSKDCILCLELHIDAQRAAVRIGKQVEQIVGAPKNSLVAKIADHFGQPDMTKEQSQENKDALRLLLRSETEIYLLMNFLEVLPQALPECISSVHMLLALDPKHAASPRIMAHAAQLSALEISVTAIARSQQSSAKNFASRQPVLTVNTLFSLLYECRQLRDSKAS